METIAMRIIQIVDKLGGNKSKFARKINVTPAYISRLGKHPNSVPSERTIFDICREFNVNEEWLRTGAGKMFKEMTREEEISSYVGNILKNENAEFQRRVIYTLSKLNIEQWEILENLATTLFNQKSGSEKEPD